MLGTLRSLWRQLYLARLQRNGLTVGSNLQMERGCNIDANFPWLISIGDNVTLSSSVCLVAHDGSTKGIVGYSRVGRIRIQNNVFIGLGALVLPGVEIGENSIIGAHSTVTHSVPPDSVAIGTPARVVMSIDDFRLKTVSRLEAGPVYGPEYLRKSITNERVEEMIGQLEISQGFVV